MRYPPIQSFSPFRLGGLCVSRQNGKDVEPKLSTPSSAATRFAPKLKEGARLGDGKARRGQTCGYYDAFRGSKTSFSMVSATWHLAPCPPAACAIAHGSGAGDGSPKRPRKYARRLVRMVFQALCHRVGRTTPASRQPHPQRENPAHKDRTGGGTCSFLPISVLTHTPHSSE